MCEVAQEKQCTKCKQVKPLTEFPKNKSRKDGYSEYCKECCCIASREWRRNNIEQCKKRQNEYRRNNAKEHTKKAKNWKRNNPEKTAIHSARAILKRSLNGIQPSEDLVRLKAQQLLLIRQIKQAKKETNGTRP